MCVCTYDGALLQCVCKPNSANRVYINYRRFRSVWMQSMLNTPQNPTYDQTIDRFIANRPIVLTTNIYIHKSSPSLPLLSICTRACVFVCCAITFILVSRILYTVDTLGSILSLIAGNSQQMTRAFHFNSIEFESSYARAEKCHPFYIMRNALHDVR